MDRERTNHPSFKEARRQLRRNQTEAEEIMWQRVRGKKLGFRFQRQFSIGCFICDFCCRSKKIVVEIDGNAHSNSFSKEYDQERDRILRELGYVVIRFSNDEVRYHLDAVINKIISFLSPLSPLWLGRGLPR